MSILLVKTWPCIVCRAISIVEVDKDEFDRWQNGTCIQDAMPNMSINDRELLINGTHPDCTAYLTKGMDDE